METIELKFLLKLLGCENYRSTLNASAFNSFKAKDKICRDLGDRGLVDYSREIASVKILPPGRALLSADIELSPLTTNELKVLENINKASAKIPPSKINIKSLKSDERDAILQRFDERGLIEVEIKIKRTKAAVWLTERGIEYLRDDYHPKKTNQPVISLDLLDNYLRFLRKSLRDKPEQVFSSPLVSNESVTETNSKPSDEEILEIIRKLDQELGTENYLPLFHLRNKLQPPLLREELDKSLYRLQRNDLIELSSLQEASAYQPEEIDAGIPQNIGGPLFFITMN